MSAAEHVATRLVDASAGDHLKAADEFFLRSQMELIRTTDDEAWNLDRARTQAMISQARATIDLAAATARLADQQRAANLIAVLAAEDPTIEPPGPLASEIARLGEPAATERRIEARHARDDFWRGIRSELQTLMGVKS